MDRLNKIERLKDELRATDYIALKYAEGIDCSQYGNWKEARQGLRNEINRFIDMTDEEYNELYNEETENENTTDTTESDISILTNLGVIK